MEDATTFGCEGICQGKTFNQCNAEVEMNLLQGN